jgi:hypothetical protein
VVGADAWLSDLVGKTKPDSSACIKEPVANTNHRREKKAKPIDAAIRMAIDWWRSFARHK